MAGEAPDYIEWLRGQLCRACKQAPCTGPHHKTGAGMGLRSHDHEAMALCGDGVRGCHGSIHRLTFGFFKGWNREQRRWWEAQTIRAHRREYLEQHSEFQPDTAEVF